VGRGIDTHGACCGRDDRTGRFFFLCCSTSPFPCCTHKARPRHGTTPTSPACASTREGTARWYVLIGSVLLCAPSSFTHPYLPRAQSLLYPLPPHRSCSAAGWRGAFVTMICGCWSCGKRTRPTRGSCGKKGIGWIDWTRGTRSQLPGWWSSMLHCNHSHRTGHRVALSNGGPDNPLPRFYHTFTSTKGEKECRFTET
jgi:hypothetical protein